MTTNFENVAAKADEISSKYGTRDPLSIMGKESCVLVLTFEEMSSRTNVERQSILDMIGSGNQDAMSTVFIDEGKLRYIVAYNKKLPEDVIKKALARELGHIVLKHDGSRPESIRNEEARYFAECLMKGCNG